MARNKATQLWTAIVTAFLALCTALGLVTTTASAAVAHTETARNSESAPAPSAPEAAPRSWPRAGALPPTMKQRIRAEAHGTSPSCRHRPTTDAATAARTAALCESAGRAEAEPLAPADPPLQR
ncbi:DUF6344 domain-containing protein [Streptomyces griseoviridis]|jgi:hypothetical protein|uniref:Secreted protein n=2 Tax=Streptomyces TaxID=1883 RepID=A0A918GI17_STRGD|nr:MULTISPECIES: DUF6344 domain-containing protein [Streptomyces]GGS37459.1 hypothetical protein GCM10010238_28610 [Streptomyces niveoruber]GGU26617.1 hypothetical protein GCM10010259_16580 [Streptomyces daghestanicus]GHI32589.1 hypothetical protein Sdagh_43190 [Streptomyces daghestanicus]